MKTAIKLLEQLLDSHEKYWVQKVRVKWHPPEGIFSKSPEEIAKVFATNSKDLKQAVARLNFARNRAGWCNPKSRNYNPKLCVRIQKAIELVRKHFKTA